MIKKINLAIAVLLPLGLVGAIFYWGTRDYFFQLLYDFNQDNERVTRRIEIDERLRKLEKVKFADLDEEYLQRSGSNADQFRNQLAGRSYYQVSRKEMNQFIVGNFRIKDFLSKDQFYRKALYDRDYLQYWLIDKRLLHRILDLQKELERKDLDPNGFRVRYGHRTPRLNEKVEGAKASRHILGEAADLVIGDINKDGKYTATDKEIVLKLLDKKVIGKRGGLGRYPGTKTVHIDVRGEKARWDTY